MHKYISNNFIFYIFLNNYNYLPLWVIGVFINILRWSEIIITGILIFKYTNSPFQVTLLLILRFLSLMSFGVFAGIIGMVPALIMFLAMLSQYPLIISESVPVNLILDKIGWNYFKIIFQVVLFGTFIETGVSLIHGFNERILSVNQTLKDHWRALIGVALLIGSIFIANAVGLIGLIAKGYGVITWGYWIIFVIPILTIGVKRIFKDGQFN